YVALEIVDAGVAADDVGEAGVLHVTQLPPVEISLIPEPVAIPQARELIGDDFLERGAEAGAWEMIFGEAADPEIDVVHRAIQIGKLLLKRGVTGDLREAGD